MDTNQKLRIDTNLYSLVRTTKCNVSFLAILESESIITHEESLMISEKTDEGKAYKLYDILKTRKNAYSVLQKAARETKQTGLLEILNFPDEIKTTQTIQRKKRNGSESRQIRFNISEPTNIFSGRKNEIHTLETHVFNTTQRVKTLVITGLGGVGKTQLVRRFIQQNSAKFDVLLWINSEQQEYITQEFLNLAKDMLKITTIDSNRTERNVDSILSDVFYKIRDKRSLFIFDNAVKTNEFFQYIPNRFLSDENQHINVTTIITSREREWQLYNSAFTEIVIGDMSKSDAEDMLTKGLIQFDCGHDIGNLINILTPFPLVLQQAISYIQQENIMDTYTIQDYISSFEKSKNDLLNVRPLSMYDMKQQTVLTIWNITLQTIKSNKDFGELAITILKYLCYISADNVERVIFFSIPGQTEVLIKNAIRLLVKYSMVYATQKQRLLHTHRLVQQVIRSQITVEDEKILLDELLKVLNNAREKVSDKNMLVLHLLHTWKATSKFPLLVRKHSRFSSRIVRRLVRGSEFSEALAFGKETTKILVSCLDKHNPELLKFYHEMAEVTFSLGKFNEALDEVECLIKLQEMSIGNHHRYTIDTKCLLAKIQRSMGNLSNSLNLYENILEYFKMHDTEPSETKTRDTLIILSEMADVYNLLTEYETSLKFYQESYDGFLKLYGQDHHAVGTLRQNIAVVYSNMGRLDEAIQVMEERFQERDRAEQKSHSLILSGKNLAFYLNIKGQYSRALDICEQTILDFTNMYSYDHPITLDSRYILGTIQKNLGHYEEAVKTYEKIYYSYVTIYGNTHLKTILLDSHVEFTRVQFENNHKYKALSIVEKNIEDLKSLCSPADAELLKLQMEFANLLISFERMQEARMILQGIKSIMISSYGNNYYELPFVERLLTKTLDTRKS